MNPTPKTDIQSQAIAAMTPMGCGQNRHYSLMDQLAQNHTTVMLQTMGQCRISLEQCIGRMQRPT